MRLLFYGLQNSGATLLTMLAGQRQRSVVIPDLWSMYCAPEIDTDLDICLKATITSAFPLTQHVAAFAPDHVFLVVRRPVDNIASLRHKHYARHNGTPEQKFAIADSEFTHPEHFTDVLVFEDVVADPGSFVRRLQELGWEMPAQATDLPRSALEMERFIWAELPELYELVQWGAGEARVDPLRGVHLRQLEDEEAAQFSRANAPHLDEFYASRRHAEANRLPPGRTALDDARLQARRNFVRSQMGIVEGLLREGHPSEALDLVTELTELAPEFADAWSVRARSLEQLGSRDLAIDLLDRRQGEVADNPSLSADVALIRARQAVRLGQPERATELANEALRLDDRHSSARLMVAELAVQQEAWDTARRHVVHVLSAQPRNTAAGHVLANVLAGEGRVEEAISTLKSCLAIQPDFEPARRRLAELTVGSDRENSTESVPSQP